MTKIEQIVKVDSDGTLQLSIPLSIAEANHEVKVTIESLNIKNGQQDDNWQQFISETAGSWAGEKLVRPDQGILEKRMDLE